MNDLTEMWAALERYQPRADETFRGESWKRMTTERTKEAAIWARPRDCFAATAAWAAAWALEATDTADAERIAAEAIEYINKAMEVQP